MESLVVKVDAGSILERVDRMFTQRPESVLLEMMQNMRRGGATEIRIENDPGLKKIVFTAIGDRIGNFQNLLHLGRTGWSDDIVKAEDPAGMGFFAASIFDRVTVESNKKKITLCRDDFKELNKRIEVTKSEQVDTKIVGNGVRFDDGVIEDALVVFPLDVYLNGKKINTLEDALQNFELVHEGEQVDVYSSWNPPRRLGYVHLSYYGHSIPITMYFKDADGKNIGSFPDQYQYGILMLPKESSTLRAKLPDRREMVENDSFRQLEKDAAIGLAKYLARSGHRMSYAAYKYLKSLYPGMTEAQDGMHHGEADVYLPRRLMADAISLYVEDELRIAETRREMRGYSWYDQRKEVEDIQVIIDDEETFSVDDLDGGLNSPCNDLKLKVGEHILDINLLVLDYFDPIILWKEGGIDLAQIKEAANTFVDYCGNAGLFDSCDEDPDWVLASMIEKLVDITGVGDSDLEYQKAIFENKGIIECPKAALYKIGDDLYRVGFPLNTMKMGAVKLPIDPKEAVAKLQDEHPEIITAFLSVVRK